MHSRDSRGDIAPVGIDAADDAGILELAGDTARNDGNFLLALVYFRRAAELRPNDAALEAKIAEAVAARARSTEHKPHRLGLAPRQPNVLAYLSALLTAVALATATALVVDTRHQPNGDEHAVSLTAAAVAADASQPAVLTAATAPAPSVSMDTAPEPRPARSAKRVVKSKLAKPRSSGRASTFLASGRATAGGYATPARPCPCDVESRHPPTQRPMGLLQLIFG